MLLCSVSAFLRDDDLKNLQVVDIIPQDSFILANGELDHIGLSVSGKGELNSMVRLVLILWRNRHSELLNPLNWLLLHFAHSGIRSGYIFPETVDYAYHIKRALLHCFPREDWSNSCTHIGKKTAYLIARLGNGEIGLISKAARNRTDDTVKAYDRDIATLHELWNSQGINFSHLVDDWRPQYLLLDRDGRTSNRLSHLGTDASLNQTVDKVLDEWVGHFQRRYPHWNSSVKLSTMFDGSLLKQELMLRIPILQNILQKPVSEVVLDEKIPFLSETVEDVGSILRRIRCSAHVQRGTLPLPQEVHPGASTTSSPESVHTFIPGFAAPVPTILTASASSPNAAPPVPSSVARVPEVPLAPVSASLFREKKSHAVQNLWDLVNTDTSLKSFIYSNDSDSARRYTRACRVWVTSSVRPILMCLKHHFNDEIKRFNTEYPNLVASLFKNICDGTGSHPHPSK